MLLGRRPGFGLRPPPPTHGVSAVCPEDQRRPDALAGEYLQREQGNTPTTTHAIATGGRRTQGIEASAGFPVAVRGLKRCSLAPSYTMPARRDRSTTPAKQEVDIESFDTYELGTSVTVFWTGEKAWYDGVIDSRRKEGGRHGSQTSP